MTTPQRLRRNPASDALLVVEDYASNARDMMLSHGRQAASLDVIRRRGRDLIYLTVWVDAQSYLWTLGRSLRHEFATTLPPSRAYVSLAGELMRDGTVRWLSMQRSRAGAAIGSRGKNGRVSRRRADIEAYIDAAAPLIDWFVVRLNENLRDGEYTVRDSPLRELVARGEIG